MLKLSPCIYTLDRYGSAYFISGVMVRAGDLIIIHMLCTQFMRFPKRKDISKLNQSIFFGDMKYF